MPRSARHHIGGITIAAADNAAKTITVPDGITDLGVLVQWNNDSPDGTLTVYAEWDDSGGSNTVRVALTSAISAGAAAQRLTVPSPAPHRIIAQRGSSSAGSVFVALLPSEVL